MSLLLVVVLAIGLSGQSRPESFCRSKILLRRFQLLEFGRTYVGRYFDSLGKDSSEMSALVNTLPNGRLNHLVSDISPQLCSQQHHGPLGENRSVCIFDVEAHLLRVDRESF